MQSAFQYKQEEKDVMKTSTSHYESSFTFVMWVTFFLICFLGSFIGGYKKWVVSSQEVQERSLQSLHSFSIDSFLVRTMESDSSDLAKVNVKIFSEDIRVKNEIHQDHDKYKELLIFSLSQSSKKDLSDGLQRRGLEEKITNNINQFITSGRVSTIQIKIQFI